MNLSPRAFFIIAMICLLGVLEQWHTLAVPGLWMICALLLVVGLMYERWRLGRVKLRVEALDRAPLRLGHASEIKVLLHRADASAADNPRMLHAELASGLPVQLLPEASQDPAWLSVNGRGIRADIPARGDVAVSFPIQPRELGNFPWKTLYAEMRGPLGLADWQQQVQFDDCITVVPQTLGEAGRAFGDVRGAAAVRNAGAGAELHYLRDYVRGDPLRSIDWKGTARRGKPVTRVHQEEQHIEIVLVVDAGRTSRTRIGALSQFGHFVNVCAQFAEIAIADGDGIGLVIAADQPLVTISPNPGRQTLRSIRSSLASVQPQPVETDLLRAALAVERIARRRSLVVLLTDLYSQSIDGRFGQTLQLWRSHHLPFVVSLLDADVMNTARQDAAGMEDVFRALAAREYMQTVRANATAANRFGARTLVTRPHDLERRLLREYHTLKVRRLI